VRFTFGSPAQAAEARFARAISPERLAFEAAVPAAQGDRPVTRPWKDARAILKNVNKILKAEFVPTKKKKEFVPRKIGAVGRVLKKFTLEE
jgi:hypothetical protein